jgi:large conductance mechanosensitive channel
MSFVDEFKGFLAKGNVVDLAVAVVIGKAFGDIVKAFVDGIVMPLVTYGLPSGMKWEQWTLGKLAIGSVLGAVVNFFIISLIVFIVLVKMVGFLTKRRADASMAVTTKACPHCLETVPKAASRCKYCTSALEA